MTELLLVGMTYVSLVYWVLATWAVRNFFKPERVRNESDRSSFTPPVSVLKPVWGIDHAAFENFASFCRQDYPEYEIVFGVASLDDPVVDVIEEVRRTYPERKIKVVEGGWEGANHKVGLLYRMEREASHEILVLCDSDMRVGPDYLRRVVSPLARSDVGLVTCPYRGEEALSLPAKLEALHMTALFLPSVVVAWKLGVSFALGATCVIRKRDLRQIGGFRVIADYLADDFQLGCRIASLGRKIVLSDYVVASVLGRTRFLDQWHREVRWARCNRVSRPREYPGILLTLPTPLAGTLAIVSNFSPESCNILLLSLAVRLVSAWLVSTYCGDREARRYLPLLPLREVLSALVWFWGLVGRRIVWRGREYRLVDEGKMVPCYEAVREVDRAIGRSHRDGRFVD